MGTIVASNISPSESHGIGGYSRDDLEAVLRRGVAPDRRLYPAMPYASYRGITDDDIDALYAWLMDQKPVHEAPAEETDLPFPFSIRTGVIAWNWLFLDDRDLPQFDDPVLKRGAYLVNHLGHCGECHTPRNEFYGTREDLYLAGEEMDGWLSPNLTPDAVTGLGGWTDQDLIEYLRTGYAGQVAQAGGPMADVVRHSTSHLDQEDLEAIVAYLREVPPVSRGPQDVPVLPPEAERPQPRHHYSQIREEMAEALARNNLSDEENLYLVHCAACHGVNGEGQPQAYYPSLIRNAALRRADTSNLLQVMLHGAPAGKIYRAPAMPGFADELSAGQIAQLVNYIRTTFGDRDDSTVTAADIRRVLESEPEMPKPLRILQTAAWVGVGLAIVVALLILWWVTGRRRHKRQEG